MEEAATPPLNRRRESTVIFMLDNPPPQRRFSLFRPFGTISEEPTASASSSSLAMAANALVVTENISRAVGAGVRSFFGLDEDPEIHHRYSLYPTIHEPPPPTFTETAIAVSIKRKASRFSRYINGESFEPPEMPLPPLPTLPPKTSPDSSPPGPSSKPPPPPPPFGAKQQTGVGQVAVQVDEPTLMRDPKVKEQLAKFTVHTPQFLALCSLIQCIMLYYSLYKNSEELGTWFDPPSVNWMLGANSVTLIELGASYAPCITSTYITKDNYICPPGVNDTFYSADNITAYCGDLGDFCKMGGFVEPDEPDQWWRFFTAIFVHAGIVHLLLNLTTQYRLGFDVERSIGHVRVMIIYLSSGVFGFLLSSIFNKTTRKATHFACPFLAFFFFLSAHCSNNIVCLFLFFLASVGCSGALYGLVAVLLVDLLQNWKLVRDPKKE